MNSLLFTPGREQDEQDPSEGIEVPTRVLKGSKTVGGEHVYQEAINGEATWLITAIHCTLT